MSTDTTWCAWDEFKNVWLRAIRGVSFEEVMEWPIIKVRRGKERTHQAYFLCLADEYIWMVPYVQHGDQIFLKTAFPSRRFTKLYKQGAL